MDAARDRLEARAARARPVPVEVRLRDAQGRAMTAPVRFALDGEPATVDAQRRVLAPPGAHVLSVAVEGHRAVNREFIAAPGAVLSVILEPEGEAAGVSAAGDSSDASDRRPLLRNLGYGGLGLALAAGVAGVVVDARTQSTLDEMKSVADEGTDRARYDALREDADRGQLWSRVLYGTAVVAGLAGAALLVVGLSGDEAAVTASPAGGGAIVRWAW